MSIEKEFNKLASDFIRTNDLNSFVLNQYNLTLNEVKQLEEWTKLKCGEVLFDSNKDNWEKSTSVLNEKIIGKSKLMFLIEKDNKDLIGYYLNTQVVEKYEKTIPTDSKTFHFSLRSNGRVPDPIKYEIKDVMKGGIGLEYNNDCYLVSIGYIRLKKYHVKHFSFVYNSTPSFFDYHGYENPLTSNYYHHFTPKRIIVIQMNE